MTTRSGAEYNPSTSSEQPPLSPPHSNPATPLVSVEFSSSVPPPLVGGVSTEESDPQHPLDWNQPLVLTPAVLGLAISDVLRDHLASRQPHDGQHRADTADYAGTKTPPPPHFSGNRKTDQADVDGFLVQCELYFELTAFTTRDETRILFAASRLTNTALAWWRANRLSIPGLAISWAIFSTALTQEFRPVEDAREAREILYSARDRNLPVGALIAEFTRQQPRIPDLSEGELLHLFLHSLPPEVKPFVLTQRPTTFTDAKRRASLAASSVPRNNNPRRPYRGPFAPQPPRGGAAAAPPPRPAVAAIPAAHDEQHDEADPTAYDVAAVAAGRRFPPPLTPEERQRLLASGGCFRCRQPGHQAQACPTFTDSGNGRTRV